MTNYRKIEEEIIRHQVPRIQDSLTIIIGNLQLLAEEKQKDIEDGELFRELINEGKKINTSITMLFPPGVISPGNRVDECEP